MNTANTDELSCYKYNIFRNTNLLINFKKHKHAILASLLVLGLICLNIYLGVLASNNQPFLRGGLDENRREPDNIKNNLIQDMLHLKDNITFLKNMVNNQVHRDQFIQATDNISINFNAVNAEVTKQIENFQNISFILNEFDRHKRMLELNISTIFSLFTAHKNIINREVNTLTRKNNNLDEIYRSVQQNISSLLSSIENNQRLIKNNNDNNNNNILNNTKNYFKNLEKITSLKNSIHDGMRDLNDKHKKIDLQIQNHTKTIQNHTKTISIHKDIINKNKQGYKIYINKCPENLKTFTSIGTMYLCYY